MIYHRENMDIHSIIYTYQRPLISIACQTLGNLEEARDAVQETFIRFWKKDPQIEGDPFHLLCRILINHCIDLIRKKSLRKFFSLEGLKNAKFLTAEDNPHQILENRQIINHVENLTKQLKPVQRAIFVLRDVQGYAIEEISHMTGFTENNIRVNLHLARKNMRKWLKPFLNEDFKVL